MITTRMLERKDCKDLLNISLIYNINGCNTRKIHVGYMKEDLHVVLAEWLTRFYIVECDEIELYPMSFVGYPYAISINKEEYYGDDHVYDIDDFEEVYCLALDRARIKDNEAYNKDYMNRLEVSSKYDIIKRAIDDNKFLDAVISRNVHVEIPLDEKLQFITNKFISNKISKAIFNRAIHLTCNILEYIEKKGY